MKWQRTSPPVVCLSLRLSAFEAGAAQERGAANSHSAAKKRIMPQKVVIKRVSPSLARSPTNYFLPLLKVFIVKKKFG
jgi:hypothetical protein